MDDDTIVALSTPPGRGAIGIIKMSGPDAESICRKLIEGIPEKITVRKLHRGFVRIETQRTAECLWVLFRGPRSFTGEDVVEISLYSNPFLIEDVLLAMVKLGGRMALPGEFTFRAFRNGKLDLIQAEAVNDLIQANSRYLARMEFGNLEGRLSDMVNEARRELLDLGVHMETAIEFQEDHCIGEISSGVDLKPLIARLRAILDASRFNDMLSSGMKVAIAGKVNAGKSTLFNSLLLEERSITSPSPGTTRDFIREKLYVDGFPFEITDMAGIQRQGGDSIEHQGIVRSVSQIERSDAVIFVLDASRDPEESDFEIFELIGKKPKIMVLNKIDIAVPRIEEKVRDFFRGETVYPLSAKTRSHLGTVTEFLKGLLDDLPENNTGMIVNIRQKAILENLLKSIESLDQHRHRETIDAAIMAEEIRLGIHLIGELTGEVSSQDILREIFGRFCIGK